LNDAAFFSTQHLAEGNQTARVEIEAERIGTADAGPLRMVKGIEEISTKIGVNSLV
jgi:hypothetical protein